MARRRRSANVVEMPAPYNRPDISSHPTSVVDDAAIARRAYEIYESRGRTDGRDVEDWLQAERELRSITTKAS